MPDRVGASVETAPHDHVVRLVVASFGGAVAALGAAVLAGWWLDLDRITRVDAMWTPMKPNAALGLLLAGLALLAWVRGPPTPRRTIGVHVAGGTLMAIGGLTLLQDATNLDLRLDRWLLPVGRH